MELSLQWLLVMAFLNTITTAQRRSVRVLFATAQQSQSINILFNQNVYLWIIWLINMELCELMINGAMWILLTTLLITLLDQLHQRYWCSPAVLVALLSSGNLISLLYLMVPLRLSLLCLRSALQFLILSLPWLLQLKYLTTYPLPLCLSSLMLAISIK